MQFLSEAFVDQIVISDFFSEAILLMSDVARMSETVTRVRDLQRQLRLLVGEVGRILETANDIEKDADLVADLVGTALPSLASSWIDEDESYVASLGKDSGYDEDESLPSGFAQGKEPRRCFKTPTPPPPALDWCEISHRWRDPKTGRYAKPPPLQILNALILIKS